MIDGGDGDGGDAAPIEETDDAIYADVPGNSYLWDGVSGVHVSKEPVLRKEAKDGARVTITYRSNKS